MSVSNEVNMPGLINSAISELVVRPCEFVVINCTRATLKQI